MELWDGGHWFQVTEDSEDFEWIDASQLARVPVLIPADEAFKAKWKENHPDSDISMLPRYMQYVPGDDVVSEDGGVVASAGIPQTTKAVFDIDVSIGEGLPSSPVSLYNIMLSLAQISLIDEATGQPRPLIGYAQFRKMMEETLGIPFDEAMEEAKQLATQGSVTPVIPGGNRGNINMSANIPGANINNQVKGPSPVLGG
jgi:hypothetical protein